MFSLVRDAPWPDETLGNRKIFAPPISDVSTNSMLQREADRNGLSLTTGAG
jgi:hypothetical protein